MTKTEEQNKLARSKLPPKRPLSLFHDRIIHTLVQSSRLRTIIPQMQCKIIQTQNKILQIHIETIGILRVHIPAFQIRNLRNIITHPNPIRPQITPLITRRRILTSINSKTMPKHLLSKDATMIAAVVAQDTFLRILLALSHPTKVR